MMILLRIQSDPESDWPDFLQISDFYKIEMYLQNVLQFLQSE